MRTSIFGKLSMLSAFFLISVILISCGKKHEKIQYKTAQGYFVNNTVENSGAYEKKFSTKEEMDKYLGMSATMTSTPTPIDFDKEFVAAYIAPLTDLETKIEVDSVIWNGKRTEMWLSIETGDKMSYTIRPVKLLLVDKKYNGGVTSFVTSYKAKND